MSKDFYPHVVSILPAKVSTYFRSEILAHYEIDSFVLKFNNLWQAGRNATLSFKSNAGKAEAHLCVELGDAPLLTGHFQTPRNSPSR
jgi:hypothetical protein